jgi:undecaprenyl diphosphate synthase
VRSLALDIQNRQLRAEEITEESITHRLCGESIADPDLIIRTAGEQRLSNFLLWQAAYSELFFSPKLWPDFDEEDLDEAVSDFRSRTRKFGALARATGTSG